MLFSRQTSLCSLVPGEEHFRVVRSPLAVLGGIDALVAVAHCHTRQALVVCEVALHDETCVLICARVFCSLLRFFCMSVHWQFNVVTLRKWCLIVIIMVVDY